MRYLQRFLAIVAVGALGVAALAIALVPAARALSEAGSGEPEPVALNTLPQRSLVYDSSGKQIATFHAEQNRAPVTLDQVPPTVRDAILAVEDENFYSHSGVNLRGILRAVVANVEQGSVEQGGSTITMQVVKKLANTTKRDFGEKVRQAVVAGRLENELTKDQILEKYVNLVYFGNGAYGVQAAAETYFGKDVQQLSWPEGAMLAALIRDPNGYDPFRHPDLAIEQRRIALQRLVETGKISQADADVGGFTPLPATPSTIGIDPSLTVDGPNAYFIEAVKQQLLDDPAYNIGAEAQDRSGAVFEGGLHVYTTLNQDMQAKALDARNTTLPDGDPNGLFAISGAGKVDIDNTCPKLHDEAGHCKGTIAMVSVEPGTGAIREVVGGPGFTNWRLDLTTSGRQPGSSMKPYVLVTALEQGNTVYDTIDGSKCSIANPGGKPDPYVVEGEGGVASLVTQLASSVNCAFLRLGQVVGIPNVITQAKKMGVASPLAATPSLPLGSSSVTPLEQAGAYAAIANDGTYDPPYYIDKITDRDGKVLYEHKANPTRVMSQQSAREATVALQAVVTGGTATRARLSDRVAAGKTGTTDKHGDAWFVGFTPQLATAVWMGSPEAVVPMNNVGGINVFGGTFPALVWHNFYTEAMRGVAPESFTPPGPPSRASKLLEPPKGTVAVSDSSTTTIAGATTATTGPSGPTSVTTPPHSLPSLPELPTARTLPPRTTPPPRPPPTPPPIPTTTPTTRRHGGTP
ncbi:MAG: transglycosylase domain-containing protein [Acidimicrobiales bacterium]